MFEKASRMKLRFEYKGLCSVEGLWDAPRGALNELFNNLATQKRNRQESLFDEVSREDEIIDLKIDIIKHVAKVRMLEAREAESEKDRADHKQRLLRIADEKEDEELRSKPVSELKKLIDEL